MSEIELRRDTILKEYDICARRADFNTGLIWTWATLLVSVNGAALGFLHRGSAPIPVFDSYLSFMYIGFAGSSVVCWWIAASNRWHEIIRILYERMDDIEAECGMAGNHNIKVHDNPELKGPHQEALRKATGRSAQANPDRGISLKYMRVMLSFSVPSIWAIAVALRSFDVVADGKLCMPLLLHCGTPFQFADYVQAIKLAAFGTAVLFVPRTALMFWLGEWPKRKA
jgi:hypothetical protein